MSNLDYIFHPRAVAVAGAGTSTSPGASFLKSLLAMPFKGPVYAIDTRGGEVMGRKVYPSIKDVPGPVDHVIVSIPARFTLDFMQDCVDKGVRSVHFFTSGFQEIGEQGAQLQSRLIEIARNGRVRVIGPNCMGIYCPSAGLTFDSSFPKESGRVAFLSQSGGYAYRLVQVGAAHGLRFSKVVSYGNAADIDESDLLEYLGGDVETDIVCAYIEGVKDGRRFLETLKDVASKKPVLVLKGGRTAGGARAVGSHTGALVGDGNIWGTLLAQTGACGMESIGEMTDVVNGLQLLSGIRGRRVGLVGVGGGASVEAADECETAGLLVPDLPVELQERLRKYTYYSTAAGSSFNNPVDAPIVFVDPVQGLELLRAVASCPRIDSVMAYLILDVAGREFAQPGVSRIGDMMVEFARSSPKPTVIVLQADAFPLLSPVIAELAEKVRANGIPLYPSVRRAARAISRVADWSEHTRLR